MKKPNTSTQSNMSTMRRHVIQEQKPERDAKKQTEDITSALSDNNSALTGTQDILSQIATNTANDSSLDILAASELQIDLQQELLGAVDSQTQVLKDTLVEGFMDTQEWISLLSEEMKNSTESLKLAPPVIPVITPPVPEIPKEPQLQETVPEDKRDERGFQESVLTQLGKLNSGMTGMAGSLTRIVFQMTLEGIKLTASILAGIVAIEFLVATVKNLWSKYGEQVSAGWEQVKSFVADGWEKVKELYYALGISEIIDAVKNLALDFSDGEFLHGIGRYLVAIGNIVADNMSQIGEAFLRAANFTGTADSVGVSRARGKMQRGVQLSEAEIHLIEEKKETPEEKEKRKRDLFRYSSTEMGQRNESHNPVLRNQLIEWNNSGQAESKETPYVKELKAAALQKMPELAEPKAMDANDIRVQTALNKLTAAVEGISSKRITSGDQGRIRDAKAELKEYDTSDPVVQEKIRALDVIVAQAEEKAQKLEAEEKEKSQPRGPVVTQTETDTQTKKTNAEIAELATSTVTNSQEHQTLVQTNVSSVNNKQTVVSGMRTNVPGFSLTL